MSKHFPDGMFHADAMEIMMVHIIEAMECACDEMWSDEKDDWIRDLDNPCNRCKKLKELRS